MYPYLVTLLKTILNKQLKNLYNFFAMLLPRGTLQKKRHQHGCFPLNLLKHLSRMNYLPSDQLRYY